jgi:hypothetical protein
VFLFLLLVDHANACSCMRPLPPCEAYKKTPAIFIALVTEIDPSVKESKGPTYAHLSIERSFKGIYETKIKMFQGTASGDCSIKFEQGKRYLIYASHDDATGQFYTSFCTRTSPIEYAGEDLDYLQGLPTSNEANRLSGMVIKYDYEDSEIPSIPELMSGVTVFAEREDGRRYEATTNNEGFYKMVDLWPGRYKLDAKLPSYLISDTDKASIVEVPKAGCATAGFLLRTDGHISGVLLDAQGRAASGTYVELIPFELTAKLEALRTGPFMGRVEETNSDGRFEFVKLKPGRYLLGVNVLRTPDGKNPFRRTFFPGVPDAAEAKIITLEKGQKLTGIDLRMPPRLPMREIRGVVVWKNGSPVIKALIILKDTPASTGGQSLAFAEPDAQGRFTLQTLEGPDAWVHASVMIPVKHGLDVMEARPVKVEAHSKRRFIRLVVSRKGPGGVEILH